MALIASHFRFNQDLKLYSEYWILLESIGRNPEEANTGV